jgi:hypothetical protein
MRSHCGICILDSSRAANMVLANVIVQTGKTKIQASYKMLNAQSDALKLQSTLKSAL